MGVNEELFKLSTPCFIIDEKQLDKNISILKAAIKQYWNNTIVGYSYKTNSLKYVCEKMAKEGFFAEVVSDDEYNLAKKLGVSNKKIIYNGIAKTEDTFIEAINCGCIVNIDSENEINWAINNHIKKLGIRVNFDIEKYCKNESAMGVEGGRFGFCYENGELGKTIRRLNSKNIQINGLHLHCSTKTRSINIYKSICNIALEIVKKYNLELDYLDIGGGFFGGVEGKVNFFDYFNEISKILKPSILNNVSLIIEPGASLIASTVKYIVSIIDTKQTNYNRFVITDGSRIHIDPLFRKNKYDIEIQKNYRNIIPSQILCGFTCIENDRICKLKNYGEFKVKDKIIFDKVGSYTMCLSPLFIKYYPEIYLNTNNNFYKIRDRWTVNEYLQKQR